MNTDSPQLARTSHRGWLKNGNRPGNFHDCARCGAKTRTARQVCKSPAMKNGRCRMHGGQSTGPRTESGLERCRRAKRKHGNYTKIRTEWIWMDNQVTACIAVSGEILEGLVDCLDSYDPAETENLLRRINHAIEKGDRILARIWANRQFRSFVQKRARGLHAVYLEYQVGVLRTNASLENDLSTVEAGSRATRLNELLLTCARVLPYAFLASNRLTATNDSPSTPGVKRSQDCEAEEVNASNS